MRHQRGRRGGDLGLICLALAISACHKTETAEQSAARIKAESETARPTFEAMMESYSRHFNAANVDSLVALYGDETHVMPPNTRPVEGREGVRKLFSTYFAQGPGGTLDLKVQSVTVSGPMAVVRTGWVFTPAAGAPMPADTGEGVAHWQKVDGRWVVVEDIWRSNLPPMPPPPTSKS
jgi:ketosteroid isomerase-like protein